MKKVRVIGAGLAGSQAALTLARAGFDVELCEMKGKKRSPAHHSDDFAELVCSNSFKARRLSSASGLLKYEARALGASLFETAEACAVPAGGALAVDRALFSRRVTEQIRNHPNIHLRREEILTLEDDLPCILASGPLTSPDLMEALREKLKLKELYFFDAAAPVVSAESLDQDKIFAASRYGGEETEDGDYLNCPFTKEEYDAFYEALIAAECAEIHEFERKKLFSACMPIEEIARSGRDSMRFGPMKPVGLIDPRSGRRPYACLQLRKEDPAGQMWNLVGFQTRLKFPEQRRVFRMIPGLEAAEFYRYGVMHRNHYIHAPSALAADLSALRSPLLFIAGQLTGLEGYVAAITTGHLAALNLILRREAREPLLFPESCMIGALLAYLQRENDHFQPMAANFGLLPPAEERIRDRKLRYLHLARRSLRALLPLLREREASCACLRGIFCEDIISDQLFAEQNGDVPET